MNLFTVAIGLLVIGIGALIYFILVLMNVVDLPGQERKGVHEEQKDPSTWLISTDYGMDTIEKIDTSYGGKPLVYLTNMDQPIEEINFEENCFPLFEIGGLAGDRTIYIHLGEEFHNNILREKLNRGMAKGQKQKLHELVEKNRRLERENKKLMQNAKQKIADETEVIKLINENIKRPVIWGDSGGQKQQQRR